MVDVYKIGVSIALQNNVSAGLKVIQRDVLGVNAALKTTSAKLAALGLGAVFAGAGALDAFKGLAKAGGAVLDAQNKMLQLGISHRDVVRETMVAYQNIGIAGTTIATNLDNLRLLRGVLGSLPAANAALPGFAKAQFVLNADKYSGSQIDMILKAMDIQGAFVNKKTGRLDPKLFNTGINEAISAILTTGGLLNGRQFYQATRLMGAAASAQSVQGYLNSTTEILASIGNRGARGIQDAAPLFIGGSMSGAQTKLLERIGLLRSKNVEYMGGGRYFTDTSKMRGGTLLAQGDIVDYLHDYFLQAAKAAGMSALQAGSLLTKPLGTVISFINSNWPQIQRSQQQQAQAAGTDQYSVAMASLSGAEQNFQTALFGKPGSPGGLMQALGVPAATMAVRILNELTGGIRNFTSYLGAHPGYADIVDKTLLGLGAGLTVLGSTAIVTGVAAMVGAGGYLALAATGIAGLGLALHAFPNALTDAEKGIQHFLYDVTHPFSTMTQASTAGGPTGSRFVPRGQVGTAHGTIGQEISDAFNTLNAWINAGAPTNVTNTRDIASAAVTRVTRALNAPSTGPSGTNLRSTPSGSAAHQQGPR